MVEKWQQVWGELRGALLRQPTCADHPKFPCISTLAQDSVNDILSVAEDRILVRSHRTGNADPIPAASFRAWWNHLQLHGTAALDPNHPNCPRSDRARLVGAIITRCLPTRIEHRDGQLWLRPERELPDLPFPEELPPDFVIEGARRVVTINAYERDSKARLRCIDAHGTRCTICGFSFGEVYGLVAEGVIHVHHLHPLSEVGEAHLLDPVEDLRPVCANCHVVLHLRKEVFKIEDVREFLQQRTSS